MKKLLKNIFVYTILWVFFTVLPVNNSFTIENKNTNTKTTLTKVSETKNTTNTKVSENKNTTNTEVSKTDDNNEDEDYENVSLDDAEEDEGEYEFEEFDRNSFSFLVGVSINSVKLPKIINGIGFDVWIGARWIYKITKDFGVFVSPDVRFILNNKMQNKFSTDQMLYDSYDNYINSVDMSDITLKDTTDTTTINYYIKSAEISSKIKFMALYETKLGISFFNFMPYLKVSLGGLFTSNQATLKVDSALDSDGSMSYKPGTESTLYRDTTKSQSESVAKNHSSLIAGVGLGLSFQVTTFANIYIEYNFYFSNYTIDFSNKTSGNTTDLLKHQFNYKIHSISIGLNLDFDI